MSVLWQQACFSPRKSQDAHMPLHGLVYPWPVWSILPSACVFWRTQESTSGFWKPGSFPLLLSHSYFPFNKQLSENLIKWTPPPHTHTHTHTHIHTHSHTFYFDHRQPVLVHKMCFHLDMLIVLWLGFLGICTCGQCLSGWSESLHLRKRGPGLLSQGLPQPWLEVSPSERGPQCKERLTGSQQTRNVSHLTTNEPLGFQEMGRIALRGKGASSLEMLKQEWLAVPQKCWRKEPAVGKWLDQIASKALSDRTFPVLAILLRST